MASLERRIHALEHELERARRGARTTRTALLGLGGLLVLVVASGSLAPQGVPVLLQTKRLELLNDTGHVVLLARGSQEGADLEFFDEFGRLVTRLGVSSHGGVLELNNDRGTTLLSATTLT